MVGQCKCRADENTRIKMSFCASHLHISKGPDSIWGKKEI